LYTNFLTSNFWFFTPFFLQKIFQNFKIWFSEFQNWCYEPTILFDTKFLKFEKNIDVSKNLWLQNWCKKLTVWCIRKNKIMVQEKYPLYDTVFWKIYEMYEFFV